MTDWSWVQIWKHSLCICKGKAMYNDPLPYLLITRSLWAPVYVSCYCNWKKSFYFIVYTSLFWNIHFSEKSARVRQCVLEFQPWFLTFWLYFLGWVLGTLRKITFIVFQCQHKKQILILEQGIAYIGEVLTLKNLLLL